MRKFAVCKPQLPAPYFSFYILNFKFFSEIFLLSGTN